MVNPQRTKRESKVIKPAGWDELAEKNGAQDRKRWVSAIQQAVKEEVEELCASSGYDNLNTEQRRLRDQWIGEYIDSHDDLFDATQREVNVKTMIKQFSQIKRMQKKAREARPHVSTRDTSLNPDPIRATPSTGERSPGNMRTASLAPQVLSDHSASLAVQQAQAGQTVASPPWTIKLRDETGVTKTLSQDKFPDGPLLTTLCSLASTYLDFDNAFQRIATDDDDRELIAKDSDLQTALQRTATGRCLRLRIEPKPRRMSIAETPPRLERKHGSGTVAQSASTSDERLLSSLSLPPSQYRGQLRRPSSKGKAAQSPTQDEMTSKSLYANTFNRKRKLGPTHDPPRPEFVSRSTSSTESGD